MESEEESFEFPFEAWHLKWLSEDLKVLFVSLFGLQDNSFENEPFEYQRVEIFSNDPDTFYDLLEGL